MTLGDSGWQRQVHEPKAPPPVHDSRIPCLDPATNQPPGHQCHKSHSRLPTPCAFNGKSTHQQHFQQWDVQQAPKAPAEEWKELPDANDWSTESRQEFTEHGVQQRPYNPPQQQQKPPTRFDGQSTHQQDFQQWDVKPTAKVNAEEWKELPDGNDWSTENRQEFTEHGVQQRPYNPPQRQQKPPTRFDGQSTHQQDF